MIGCWTSGTAKLLVRFYSILVKKTASSLLRQLPNLQQTAVSREFDIGMYFIYLVSGFSKIF